MQHPNTVDVFKGSLPRQIQQTALFKAHLSQATGTTQSFTGHLKGTTADVYGKDFCPWIEMGEVVGANARTAARIKNAQGFASRWGCAGAMAMGSPMAPTPVVARGWTVLEGITWVGEAVVESTHHRGGPIGSWGNGYGHQIHGSAEDLSLSFTGLGCKHLFI